MSTKNTNKKNVTINEVVYNVLCESVCNKNALTRDLLSIGVFANMRTKTPNDFTTVNNDLYFQLVDGTRIFFGTNRKKIQLWCTDDFCEHFANDDNSQLNELCNNELLTSVNDSIRHYKTSKTIEFTFEWFDKFFTKYCELYTNQLLPTK